MHDLLIHAENTRALTWLLEERKMAGTVDLVYIDPPFATNCAFTVSDKRASTISAARDGAIAYTDFLKGKEFVEFIRQRLLLLRELLSPQGSLYLHTDYKIGHYVKVMMDDVFGIENFRNDITRVKCNPKNFQRTAYGNIKDMILFYSRGKSPIWHEPYEAYQEEDVVRLFPKRESNGRRYTTVPIHAPGECNTMELFRGKEPPVGRHWRTKVSVLEAWDDQGLIEWSSSGNPRKKIYADEKVGKRVQDIWTDCKDPMYPAYPTEKNLSLLERIVQTSSNPGSVVLDCFCGSGTTLLAAARQGRRWIGIDQSELAIAAAKRKLALDDEGLFPASNAEVLEL